MELNMIPTVTVILPCYNGARWIVKTIESIQAQTYPNFELLIIDDGSIDCSRRNIESFLRDGRIRYIYQNNQGFSAALNRGLKESKGEFISFIGQDDLWIPEKLSTQIEYLNAHKESGIVFSDYYTINLEGKIIESKRTKMPHTNLRKEIVKRLFLNNFIGFETVLVRRQCFDIAGNFDEQMVGFSDHDLWLRIAGQFNLSYIASFLVKKRSHEFQLSKRKESVLRDEFLLVEKALHKYPFLSEVKNRKCTLLYYSLAITYLHGDNLNAAKKNLLKAIRIQPWNLKAVFIYLAPGAHNLILYLYTRVPLLHKIFGFLEN